MASERLQVILQLVAGQYKREAKQASSATGKVTGSMGKADTATGKLGKSMQGVGTIAKVALAGAATAAVGKFVSSSISAASDLGESLNALEVTFGKHAEGIPRLGEEAATNLGLSNEKFNSFAVQISAFAQQIAGDGGDVVGVVDELSTRVTDFASVMNLEVAEAAQKFQSGLAGESEPLRKFGIDVSAAKVEAFAFANGIAEAGEKLTEAQKVTARYGTIMQQTEQVQGDFANTSDQLANSQRIFSAELENAQAEIGEKLLPVMTDLVNTGRDLLPLVIKLADGLGLVAEGLAIVTAGSDFERLSRQTGEAVDNVAGLGTAIVRLGSRFEAGRFAAHTEEFTARLGDFLDEADLAPDEIRAVVDNMSFLTDEMGLTGEAAEVAAEILRDELINSLTDEEEAARAAFDATEEYTGGLTGAEKAARTAFGPIDNLAGAVDKQGGKWDDVVTSMEEYETMIRRLTDPVFAAIDDQKRLEDATQKYLDVIDDPESTVGEHEDAMLDLVQAQIAAEESAAELPDDLQVAADHIAILGDRAGITDEDLRRLKDRIMEFDGLTAQSTISINVVGGERVPGDMNRDIVLRQHGGPVRAGQPAIVGEAGPELFIPDVSGQVVPNQSIPQNLTSQSGFDRTVEEHHHYHLEGTGEPETDAQRVGSLASVIRRMETL